MVVVVMMTATRNGDVEVDQNGEERNSSEPESEVLEDVVEGLEDSSQEMAEINYDLPSGGRSASSDSSVQMKGDGGLKDTVHPSPYFEHRTNHLGIEFPRIPSL